MTKKIICAIDDTEHAESAIIHAAELAAKTGAPLTLCTVNVMQGGLRGPATYLHDGAEIKRILEDAVSLAERYGARKVSETALEAREVADAVVQYAQQNGFDHIVAGTGDKRGLCRLALGSVAANIAGKAHCTVTIAR